nr:neuraminidase-like domain-containing protein [uncultured Pseudomonas sp.]
MARLVSPTVPQTVAGWEKAFQSDAQVTNDSEAFALAMCQALGLEATQWVAPLLRWAKVDGKVLAARIDAIRLTCPTGSSPLGQFSPSDLLQWNTLQRHAEVVNTFKLSSDVLAQLALNPSWFDLQGPDEHSWRALDLTTVYQLGRYKALLAQLAPQLREQDVLAYMAEFDTRVNGPVHGARIEQAWTALERLLESPVGNLAAVAELDPPTTLRGLDHVLRLMALSVKHGLSLDTLLDLGKLPQSTADDYASFQQAATGLRKACSAAQRKTLDQRMSLAWRDALLQWMLAHWVPLDDARRRIASPQALADYLLIDLQVSHEPLTTQLLSATASLQRYLHQIHSRLENGYSNTTISDQERDDWEGFSSSYERWKLRQDAHNEPQNFIDPTRRQRKTKAFAELETQLGQGKCRPEDIRAAMLSYLSTFETLSNIQPISVYADGNSPLTDTYHFIGKTNVAPTEYYWRTLDMSQRDPTGTPSMLAWGEWEKITLTVNGEMALTPLLEEEDPTQGQDPSTDAEAAPQAQPTAASNRTALALASSGLRSHIDLIRPVIIAGRRYAVWVERDATAIPYADDNKPSPYHALRVCFSYQQTDGTWTPANTLMCLDGRNEQGQFAAPVRGVEQTRGTSQDNRYLKTRDFQPGLIVMVDIEGDRLEDPWLTVMLFDALARQQEQVDSAFIIMKDLLLLEEKSTGTDRKRSTTAHKVAADWLKLFRRPQAAQHPYEGLTRELRKVVDSRESTDDTDVIKKPHKNKETYVTEAVKSDATISADGTLLKFETKLYFNKLEILECFFQPFPLMRYIEPENASNSGLKDALLEGRVWITIHRLDTKKQESELRIRVTGKISIPYVIHINWSRHTEYLSFTIESQGDEDLQFFTIKSTRSSIEDKLYFEQTPTQSAPCSFNAYAPRFLVPQPSWWETTAQENNLALVSLRISPTQEHGPWKLSDQDEKLVKGPLRGIEALATDQGALIDLLKVRIFKSSDVLDSSRQETNTTLAAFDGMRIDDAIDEIKKSYKSQAKKLISLVLSEELKALTAHTESEEQATSLLDFKYSQPETLIRILTYINPTHELTIHAPCRLEDPFGIIHFYPARRDLKELKLEIEVFLDHRRLPYRDALIPIYYAKAVYALESQKTYSSPIAFIRRNDHQALYLDLTEANNIADATHRLPSQNLRLNTLFGKQLVALATQSVDRALSWQAQQLPEPALEPGNPPTTVDFRSANGLYFWELFFHVPFLIVWLQRQNREYTQAWRWCTRYLFDPYRTSVSGPDQPPPFWLTRPLLSEAAYAVPEHANDPDLLAYAEPERYRKALHLFVVQTWQRQGDDQYRLLTPDSLVEAALCYDKALRLIGVLPEHLSSAPAQAPTLAEAHSSDFTAPLNNALIELRNLLRNRLFNLRHGLTLDGKPAAIMLEPAALERLAQGQGDATQDRREAVPVARVVPPCHYDDVRKCAGEAVLQLIELGQTQLRFYESEAAQQLELASKTHIIQLLEFPYRLEQQALQLARRERETVLASQQMLQTKRRYYQDLVDEGITDLETAAMVLGGISQTLNASSMPFEIAAGLVASIPTIYGLAFGGADPAQPMARTAAVLKSLGKVSELVSDDLRLRAEYELRSQQWQFEADQASFELKIVEQQLLERDIHIRAATIALEEALAKLATHCAEYEIMTSVFTSRPTYLWMIGRMSEIYSSAYDATLSLCLMAEACLQYELGDFDSTWIRTDGWLDNWRGMLAGEALERDLIQMDVAAIRDNHRPLDIHADFSLLALTGWSQAELAEHLGNDVIPFELTAKLFDQAYPGHYLRRIERIWLTFKAGKVPASASLSAMLQQTANRVLLKEDIEGVKHLYAVDQGNGSAVLRDLRPNQSIAVWAFREVNRNYDLQPSIPDKTRYQPFEGTGLLSSWRIEFPGGAKHNPALFEGDLCKLEDITVHVIYSAVAGSERFRDEVKGLLKSDFLDGIDSATQPGRPTPAPGNADNALVSAKDAEQAALAAYKAATGSAADPALEAADAAGEKRQAMQAVADAQAAAAQATAARKSTQVAAAAGKYAEAGLEAAKADVAKTKALAAERAAAAARDAAQSRDRKRRDDALSQARAAEQKAETSAQAARQAADSEVLKSPEASAELKTAQAAAAQASAAAKEAKTAREKAEQAAQTDTLVAQAAKADVAAEKAKAAAALVQQAKASAQAKAKAAAEAKEKAAAEAKEKEKAAADAKEKEKAAAEAKEKEKAAAEAKEKEKPAAEAKEKEQAAAGDNKSDEKKAADIVASASRPMALKDLLNDIADSKSDALVVAQIERIVKKYDSTTDFEARRALMHAKIYASIWRVHLATLNKNAASTEGRQVIQTALADAKKLAKSTCEDYANPFAISASSAVLAVTAKIEHAVRKDKDVQTAIDYFESAKRESCNLAYLKDHLHKVCAFGYRVPTYPTAHVRTKISNIDEQLMTFTISDYAEQHALIEINQNHPLYIAQLRIESTDMTSALPDWSKLNV